MNSSVVARVTLSEACEWARLPSAEGLLSGRDPREVCTAFFAALCKLVLGGTKIPKGRNAKQKTECRRAPESPEAVTEHKTGYKTADRLQSKVGICTRPAEVRRDGRAIRADISSARTAIVGTERCRSERPHLSALRRTRTRGRQAEMAEMDIVKLLDVQVSLSRAGTP